MRQRHCDVPSCDRRHKGRGLCAKHLLRARRNGQLPDVGPPPRSGEQRLCATCGTEFYAYPSFGTRRGRYCSLDCRNVAYEGPGNPKWRGGRVPTGTGYVYAYAPDHPHATAAGYVMEHRLVVEAAIGRYLEPHEQVHHRNHVRDDNRPENLQLMADVREHRRHHGYRREFPCGTCGTTVERTAGWRNRWTRAFCSRRCAALAASEAAARTARTC